MPDIAGARALPSAQRGMKRDMRLMFDRAGAQIRGILSRYEQNGSIPVRYVDTVSDQCGQIVLRLFVGADGRSPYAQDGATPLAPYPRLLNKWYVYVMREVMLAHQAFMKRNLPDDLYAALSRAQQTRETITPVPQTNQIIADYDPMHTFVDPNGYTLSRRIWQNGRKTQERIDALVSEGIRLGLPSTEIATLVERFLAPDRAPIRTKKPYGQDGSFDAMRLARTEITAAHGRVTVLASQLNPYVDTITWRLSPSHPRSDICDTLAARSPYPKTSVPRYPAHPHCLCVLLSNVTKTPAEVSKELRDWLDGGNPAPLTPANALGLLLTLLGGYLFQEMVSQQP